MKSLLQVSFILRLPTDKQEHQEVTYQTFWGTYPKDKSKSQMFFLSDIPIGDVVETISENDPIKQCSLLLREELQNFDFSIDNRFKSAKDLTSLEKIYQTLTWLQKKRISF